MKNKIKPAAPGADRHRGCVGFELTRPTAQEVCLAGSFNDWHPSVTPMIRLNDGQWVKELALPPGRYEYRFVVDGEWVDDPAAAELIPNPFGTANAVLVVAASPSVTLARSASATPSTLPPASNAKPSAE